MTSLLYQHNRLMREAAPLLSTCFSAQTRVVLAETRAEFERLLPHIPDIGGAANPLTDTLHQMTSLLALYFTLKRRGVPLEEIGALVQQMAQAQIDRTPHLLRRLLGGLYMTRFWRDRTRRRAAESQQRIYPGNFVYEVVETSDGWGVDYHECGVVKFFHAQGADEFTPYMCLIDFLIFPAMGLHLERTGTIANGCARCDFRYTRPAP